MPDFVSVKNAKAMKVYVCEWCHEPIARGARYERLTFSDQIALEYTHYRVHVSCAAAVDRETDCHPERAEWGFVRARGRTTEETAADG